MSLTCGTSTVGEMMAVVNELTASTIALSEATTPKLSELALIGSSPSAKLYSNGLIVGATNNGEARMHPDGRLECRKNNVNVGACSKTRGGVYGSDAPESAQWDYPKAFLTVPIVSTSNGQSAHIWTTAQTANNNYATLTAYSWYSRTDPVEMRASAVGIWK